MIQMKTFYAVLLSFPTLLSGLPTPTTTTRPVALRCPVYYYFDDVTELCEFCCDICCNAKIKSTEEECSLKCPEYAKKLQDDAQKLQDSAQKMENHQMGQEAGHTLTWNLPLGAQIAVPLIVCLIIVLLAIFIYSKRRTIVSKFGGRQAASANNDDDLVTTPFQRARSEQPDTDSREVDISLQEETYHDERPQPSSSLSRGRPTPFPDPAWHTASFRPGTSEPVSPVLESMDGREGPKVMVLPSSRRIADSTELRTVQVFPSVQETTL